MTIAAAGSSGREKKLDSLLGAARRIARPKELDEKVEEILRECSRMTGARGGSLYIQEGSVLRLSACLDPGHAARTLGLPLSESSILARVERTRAPLLIRALGEEKEVTRSSWKGYKDGSALLFPLLDAQEDILGIVALHNKERPPFTARDLDRGSILCSFGGEALALHRSEMSLTGSERPYREVFEHSSSGIIIFEVTADERFRILSMNPALERMTGISAADAEGKFVEEVLSREEATKQNENYRKCIAEGSPLSLDDSLEVPTGHRTFHTTYIPLRDVTGRIHRLIALPIDTTEHRRAEETLRESEARYREIFDNSADGIFMLEVCGDGQFRTLEINPAEEKRLGMSSAAASGKRNDELVPAETAAHLDDNDRKCVAAGRPISFDDVVQFPTGRYEYHTTLAPVRDQAGRIYRIVGVSRDVTENRRMERALKQSEEKFSKSFHASPDSITISRLDDGALIEVNRGFIEAYGYTREGVTGRSALPSDLAVWDDARDRERLVALLKKEGNRQYNPTL